MGRRRRVPVGERGGGARFARFLSFTVSVPLEARFSLSSSKANRLFLLEGAGTGGRVLASAGAERATWFASFWRVLQPGSYTLETTTRHAGQEGEFTVEVDSMALSPADSCTAPLGAVAAGAAVSRSGAWDRGDGCRSVNATADRASRYYADYVSFTVSAAVEVSVRLSGGGGKRLYLLQGAGAGGRVVASAAGRRGGAVALRRTLAAGSYTLETAAYTAGSAEQSLAVSVTSAAPAAVGSLAARTLTAGGSVAVDVSGAFSGTVDSYTVTSGDAAVVGVALAGPVVTLTGVAAGTATVTVTAANAAGGASQTMAVTVGLPPPPALAAPLAAQALQVTETLTVDVASGFAGRIDAYAAVAGDADKLTVAVDGAEVALTGARAGATTVTVTAVNAAGRAARSFAVTVEPLTAPRAAGAPVARTIAVGEELPVHVADAFSGVIRHYRATSNAPSVVTVSVDGAAVTLAGAAAGTATVTLEAVNDAGAAAQTLPVTVEVPEQLAVAVNAPSHCLGSEGTLAPGGGRRGVGSIRLTYHVTGGAPPYAITSPDSADTAAEPTGALTVPCSRRGVDLAAAGPDMNVVEAGPRTLTITATDNTGATTAANIGIEVAEDAYTTAYNGGLMHPGRTYVLGTREQWVLLTLPEGLTLRFTGLSEGRRAHFTEPATGERSAPAPAATVYSCGSGYSLVRIPLGGQYCRKSTAATAKYSCPGGYTLSGKSCYKYTYTNPTGATCPAGYTLVYNGIFAQCRKKLTADATVTYSCSSGRLSGSECVFTATPTPKTTYSCRSGRLSGSDCILTATPTAKTTYSCRSGRLSGSDCILTATPTAKTTYSCRSGRLSGSDCILTATPTAKTTYSCRSGRLSGSDCILTATPTAKTTYSCSSGRLSGSDCILTGTLTVTYDCDDAPPGYTLSGTDCTKTITKQPTRPTTYTCPAGYDRNEPPGGTGPPTCTKTDTIDATVTITPASCPAVAAGEPPYRLYEDHFAGGVKHTCERTLTVDAEITRTYTCPPNYRLETTTTGGDTDRACRLDKPA